MMITDTSGSDKTTADLSRDLDEIGESIGVKIHCQREDIFDMMHRI